MNNNNYNNNKKLEKALKNLENQLIRNIDENNNVSNDTLRLNTKKRNKKILYHGAGTIFTNNKVVICGYQRKYSGNKKNFISGFGGSREGNEDYLQTAIRETIEEIYDFENNSLPTKMIDEILQEIKPTHIERIVENKKGKEYIYIFLKYNLNDLQIILEIVQHYMNNSNNNSLAYDELPMSLEELLFLRKDSGGEIISICVLPVDQLKGRNVIDNGFKNDIELLYHLAKK